MLRSPRATRRIGWMCIIAGLMVGTVLVMSLWKTITICIGDRTMLGVEAGALTYFHAAKGETIVSPRSSTRTIAIDSTRSDLIWRFHSSASNRGSAFVAPFWPALVLLIVIGTVLLFRTRQIAGPWCRTRTYLRSSTGCGFFLLALAVVADIPISFQKIHGILITDNYGIVCETGKMGIQTDNRSFWPLASTAKMADLHWGPFFGGNLEKWYLVVGITGIHWVFAVPLYVLVLLALGSGIALVIRAQPALAGHCLHCRYNLTGLPPASPCPECGRPSPRKEA